MTINEIFAVRGSKAKVSKALLINRATVTKWKYVPTRHLKAVSLALGIAQKHLPRKGDTV